MVFGAGRPNGPGARFHVGTLRREIAFIPKTTAGTWLTCGRGRRPRRPAPRRGTSDSQTWCAGAGGRAGRAPLPTSGSSCARANVGGWEDTPRRRGADHPRRVRRQAFRNRRGNMI